MFSKFKIYSVLLITTMSIIEQRLAELEEKMTNIELANVTPVETAEQKATRIFKEDEDKQNKEMEEEGKEYDKIYTLLNRLLSSRLSKDTKLEQIMRITGWK